MNPETLLQNKIRVALSQKGAIPYRMNVGQFYTQNFTPIKIGIDGTPDLLIICPNGKVLWYELKTATGKLRHDQEIFHHQLSLLNHLVFTVRSVDEAIQIYDKYGAA